MGKLQFWKLERDIITKSSCRKGKSNVLCVGKRTPEKREDKKFDPAKDIFFLIAQSCLVGQTDLFGLIQDD